MQKQLSEPSPDSSHEGKPQAMHSVGELERVINAMKKVIEKLQTENEKLKRIQGASNPAQIKAEGGKKTATLQEENSRLKVCICG